MRRRYHEFQHRAVNAGYDFADPEEMVGLVSRTHAGMEQAVGNQATAGSQYIERE